MNHELKATSTRLTYQKKTLDRKRINKHFANNPRNVYRSFRGNSTDIKEILSREEVGKYWNNIWGKQENFNNDASLTRTLIMNIPQIPNRVRTLKLHFMV